MGNDLKTQQKPRRKFTEFYVAGDKLGSGTFAVVRRCLRIADKRLFAVKVIDKRNLTAREVMGLRDEIRILKLFQFPHLILMADAFDSGRTVRIVLELCEGGDLFDQIVKSPSKRFSEKKCAYVACVLAHTIEYMHQNSVVHRDLKPENILFTKSGVLKITDFGLAHFLKTPKELHVMHTACGTPHYVAPEVLASTSYSPAVDYWSLGVILYVMLCGHQPFTSPNIKRLYQTIINGEYSFKHKPWDTISDIAKDCVKGLMCVNVNARMTAAEIMHHPFIKTHVNLKKLHQQEQLLLKEQQALLVVNKNWQHDHKKSTSGNKVEKLFPIPEQNNHNSNSNKKHQSNKSNTKSKKTVTTHNNTENDTKHIENTNSAKINEK